MNILQINLLQISLLIFFLFIITYLNIWANLLSKKNLLTALKRKEKHSKKIYLFYTLIFLAIIFSFLRIDFGVFNDARYTIIFMFILVNLIFNILTYLGSYKFTKRELFKAITFLYVIWFFVIPSILINEGIYFSPTDHDPDWTVFTTEYINNNETYNLSLQVEAMVSSMHGFFIDSPLVLQIYGGFVRFNKGNISNDSKIEVKINLMPHPYDKRTGKEIETLTILKTKQLENNTYSYILSKEPRIIGYHYSGLKELNSIILVDGIEVTTIKGKELVEIEKGYVKSQFDLSKSVIILTLWIIFLSLVPLIERTINWSIKRNPSRFLDYEDGFDYI